MIMDNKPMAQHVLDALLITMEVNLNEARENYFKAYALWNIHKSHSGNIAGFYEHVHDMMDDLATISKFSERIHMCEYVITLINDAKEFCE